MRNIVALSLTAAISVFALGACSSDAGSKDQAPFDLGEGNGGNAVSAPSFEAKPYPAAPYGTQIGSVIAPYEFLGWKDGSVSGYDTNAFEKLSLADYYDPTGETGVKYIMINSSAVWCTACRAEYKYMDDAGIYDTYRQKGVEFMGAIFEDGANPPNPAAPKDLAWWASNYNVKFPMLLDPGFKTGAFFTADATPMNLLVDTKDMRIVVKILGGDLPKLLQQADDLLAGG